MEHEQRLPHVVESLLAQKLTLDEFYYWLVEHSDETERDLPNRELADRAWILISEFDLGHRSEESVREELAAFRVAV